MTNEKMTETKLSEEDYKLAEEVIKPIYHNAIKNDFSFAKYGVECYLAGLKAGRPKWHKVADGDLPNNDRILSDQDGNNVRYVKHRNKWFYRDRTCEANVIAWCETLKYTEE